MKFGSPTGSEYKYLLLSTCLRVYCLCWEIPVSCTVRHSRHS